MRIPRWTQSQVKMTQGSLFLGLGVVNAGNEHVVAWVIGLALIVHGSVLLGQSTKGAE